METFTPPPRKLHIFTRLILLFGNTSARIGWYFWGFGMIFFWIFFMNSEILHIFDSSEWEGGVGKLKRVRTTNAEENEESIMEYIYEYEVEGHTYTGRGYVKGEYEGEKKVKIQYRVDDHRYSKLTNGRREKYATWVGFIIILPLFGLVHILLGMRAGLADIRILVHGVFTKVKLIEDLPGNGEGQIPDYTIKFRAENGSTQTIYGYNEQEGEHTDLILYLPKKPYRAILYESMPDLPNLDLDGNFEPLPPEKIKLLAIPLIAILMNVVWIWVEIYIL